MRHGTLVQEAPSSTKQSEPDGSSSNPIPLTSWLLRVGILLHALGVAVALFTRAGSPLGSIALMDWGIPHSTIFLSERIAACLLVGAAASLFVYRQAIALPFIFIAIFIDAYARQLSGGEAFSQYAVGAAALRWLLPLALFVLISRSFWLPSRSTRIWLATWVLRIGLATVFITHGLEALGRHPGFIDLLISSARTWLHVSLKESLAVQMLFVIGVVDILVAVLLLIRPWKTLLAWLCFWGLITALSRPLAHGFASYPEVLLRVSHFLAPVAIWWLSSWMQRQKTASTSDSTAS